CSGGAAESARPAGSHTHNGPGGPRLLGLGARGPPAPGRLRGRRAPRTSAPRRTTSVARDQGRRIPPSRKGSAFGRRAADRGVAWRARPPVVGGRLFDPPVTGARPPRGVFLVLRRIASRHRYEQLRSNRP